MASNTQKPVGPPEVSPSIAIKLLSKQAERAESLLVFGPSSDELSAWELVTENLLAKAFGQNSPNIKEIISIGRYGSFPANANEAWWLRHRVKSLNSKLARLNGLIEILGTEADLLKSQARPAVQIQTTQQFFPIESETHVQASRRVFLVHGHDESLLHEVARYLEKLRLEPIILHEQPNEGRTIIEKFVEYADVDHAIILLTPDDIGGIVNAPINEQRPRARQNVILELGYFLGKLQRNRVTALYVDGVEIPSDYSGVVFVEVDNKKSWQIKLARELNAAGLDIDMNLSL